MENQACLDCGNSLTHNDIDYDFLCQECGDWLSGFAPKAIVKDLTNTY